MRQLLDGVRGKVGRIRADSRHRDFVDTTMAACALVALADDDHRLSELVARDRIIHLLDRERTVDVNRAVAAYERYSKLLETEGTAGRKALLEIVAGVKGDREKSEQLIRLSIAVGRADQQFSARERSVVEDICHALRLHPADLGVYDL
jgi:tellurite resistance protein